MVTNIPPSPDSSSNQPLRASNVSSAPAFVWVKYGDGVVKVSLAGCSDVFDIIKATKEKLKNRLEQVKPGGLLLYSFVTEDSDPLRPGVCISALRQNTDETPYILRQKLSTTTVSFTAGNNCWMVTGKIVSSLFTKGVRKTLFRIANYRLASYHKDCPTFEYDDGGSLKICAVFTEHKEANLFRADILAATDSHQSPLYSLRIDELRVVPVHSSVLGNEILLTDYKAEDSNSPPDNSSIFASSAITLLEMHSELFRYQRIEKVTVFYTSSPTIESCHFISKSHCRQYETYSSFEDDENNKLAMSPDMHRFFDGVNKDHLPLFKLNFVRSSAEPTVEGRYEVEVCLVALDKMSSTLIFPRLSDGSTLNTESDLEMKVRLYVKDVKRFRRCLEWKSNNTTQIWKKYQEQKETPDRY